MTKPWEGAAGRALLHAIVLTKVLPMMPRTLLMRALLMEVIAPAMIGIWIGGKVSSTLCQLFTSCLLLTVLILSHREMCVWDR